MKVWNGFLLFLKTSGIMCFFKNKHTFSLIELETHLQNAGCERCGKKLSDVPYEMRGMELQAYAMGILPTTKNRLIDASKSLIDFCEKLPLYTGSRSPTAEELAIRKGILHVFFKK